MLCCIVLLIVAIYRFCAALFFWLWLYVGFLHPNLFNLWHNYTPDIEESDDNNEKKGQYTKFWNEFGKSIKLGIIEDAANRNRLAKLLRFERYICFVCLLVYMSLKVLLCCFAYFVIRVIFLPLNSTKSEGKLTSLDQYIKRMKPGQKDIFYITGTSKEQLEKSPFLERLIKKNYEVLLNF